MKFVDRVRIQVSAGDGGDGLVSWRREAHVPKGGPFGGDGGNGGDVYLEADDQLSTLLDLKYRQHHRAEPGRKGGNKGMHGRCGEDLIIRVPAGTGVYFEGEVGDPGEKPPWVATRGDEGGDTSEMENIFVMEDDEDIFEDERFEPTPRPVSERAAGELIGDLTVPGERLLIAKGGQGGGGNMRFRSSTNRAPDRAESGTPGEALWVRLELKLMADIGIVGFPNVGKSTLINKISRSRSEIGDYPFTTLVPQLGVVSLSDERSMVVADVPGLVRGASAGRGLGHEFLRHLERTRVLLHLLAPDLDPKREPLEDLKALEEELTRYGDMFEGRPRVVALNKIDGPAGEELIRETRKALRKSNIPLFPISAITGEGVDAMLEALWRRLELLRSRDRAEP